MIERNSKSPLPGPRDDFAVPPESFARNVFCSCVALVVLFAGQATAQSGKSDILLFVSGEFAYRSPELIPELSSSDFTPSADLLFTYSKGPWRILGEYFLTDEESELERLQFGFDASEYTTAWLGRFHQPISAWNFKYHHGAYLQPSITRPAVENWEDEGGVLPSHATGIMIESGFRRSVGEGFRYAASAGMGPILTNEGLHPFDLVSQENHDNGLTTSVAFSYYPDFVGSTNIGLVAGYTDIMVEPRPAQGIDTAFQIEQLLISAQVDWQWDKWQLIGAIYYVDNDAENGFEQYGGSFVSTYAQILRQLTPRTGIFGRYEGGNNTKSAGYLSLFPLFISGRLQVGGRFDFADRQAISLEISAVETKIDDYTEVRIQWSGVFQ